MNYSKDKEILESNSSVNQHVKDLISIYIDTKKTVIDDSHGKELTTHLLDHGVVEKHVGDNNYYISEKSYILGSHLIKDAEARLNQKLPLDISSTINFILDYEKILKHPRQNYNWCSSLIRVITKSALLIIHTSGADLINEIDHFINENSSATYDSYLKNYIEKYLFEILENLEYSIDRLYNLSLLFLQEDKKMIRSSVCDFLKRLADYDINTAIELYEYSNQKGDESFNIYFPFLLQGIYNSKPQFATEESIKFIKDSPEISFYSLINFNYSKSQEIDKTIQLIEANADKISIIDMPKFYSIMLEKDSSSQEQKQYCIEKLITYSSSDNEQLISNLIFWTEAINDFEKEKVQILENLQARNIFPQSSIYFSKFNDSKPIFNLIKKQAVVEQNFQYEYYKDSLNNLASRDAITFNLETIKLLSSEDKSLRLLGWKIVNGKFIGMHKLQFDSLTEEEQLIAMNTLMSHPIDIESLLHTVIDLFKSRFATVTNAFKGHCKELLNGYGGNLIFALESSIDKNHDPSLKLIGNLKDEHESLANLLNAKAKIKEFDPFLNQNNYVKLYYSLNQEKEDMMMEQAQTKEGFFAQIATRIPVVRGNGFKSETNPMITKLQRVTYEKQLNKNYYQDPIGFEENL